MQNYLVRKAFIFAISILIIINAFAFSLNGLIVIGNKSNDNVSIDNSIIMNAMVSYGDPEINDVQAIPSSTFQGGYVNITCNVTDDVVVDEVSVNITYPDNSYHNHSMLGAQLGIEDFSTFEELDPNNHIDVTSTRVDHVSWHNEDSYLVKNYSDGYFDDFVHYLEIGATAGYNSRARTYWQVCNSEAPYVELFLSNEVYISIYLVIRADGNRLQMTEHLSSSQYFDSYSIVDFNTEYYLTIIKNGTDISCEIYTDPERTNLNGTLNLTLHDNHSFSYLYAANSWNTSVPEYADGWCANLSFSPVGYYFNTTYTMVGTYTYYIWANDTFNNSNRSANYSFMIGDTTSPQITDVVDIPDPQEIGGHVNISCNVTDNVAVDEVWVNITYPDSSYHNMTMIGNSYYYNTTYTQVGMYDYFIWANDTSNNSNISDNFTFEIINQPPYAPSNPHPVNGSTNVNASVDLSWIGGDPDGDPVTYTVYFGNSSPPPKVVDNQTNNTYDPGILDVSSTYYWRIVVWDNHNAFTKGSIWWFSTVENQPPFKPTVPSGPAFGKPGIQLHFSTVTSDPEGKYVYYMWDWGDNSYSPWFGPFDSGEVTSASHAWSNGVYNIRVKAMDVLGAESEWSESLIICIEDLPPQVEITKPTKALYIFNYKIMSRFFGNPIILGKIDITVDVADDSGIKKVEFYIDDELRMVDQSSPYIYTWTRDRMSIFGHKHTIKVVAFDNAGNSAIKNIKTFKIL